MMIAWCVANFGCMFTCVVCQNRLRTSASERVMVH